MRVLLTIFLILITYLFFTSCDKEENPLSFPEINQSIPEGTTDTTQSIFSNILKQSIHYSVFLPYGYDTSKILYPVLYLLHGMGGNHQDWIKHDMARTLNQSISDKSCKSMVVIMPEGKSGFYCNNFHGMDFRYDDFLIQELIPQMELKYRLKSSRKSRAIAGLSMGGYGTVLNAFKHPDIFCAAYAMSAAIDMGTDAPDIRTVINEKLLDQTVVFPAFTLECGTEDFLYSSNQSFNYFLLQKGINHTYLTSIGTHNWNFWKNCLPKTLKFVSNNYE